MLRNIVILLIFSVKLLTATAITSKTTKQYSVIDENIDDIANRYADEYMRYLDTGMESEELKQMSSEYRQRNEKGIYRSNIPELDEIGKAISCTICRITAEIALRIVRLNLDPVATEKIAGAAFQFLCTSLNLQTAEVCRGLFNLNWPILYYILKNTPIDGQTLCGIFPISFCKIKQHQFNWCVNVDHSKGPLMGPKATAPQKTGNDLVILQLTDIHYDPEYKPGSLADCKEPLCCRLSTPDGDGQKAGYWSDYHNCDSPLHMIENALDHIVDQHKKIDYIYSTGDLVPHNVWSTTRESNKALISETNDLLMKKFGNLQVYPALGNHEVHPANVFGHKHLPEEFKSDWLYEHLWSVWQRWLPTETKETILEGGYYTVSPKPGFRIIALNNNDCYLFNWWLYYDGTANSSRPQLQWLHDTLLKAEQDGEYVHILDHIPSGSSDCWSIWAREFNRIIERFSNTISGIFNGHTHKDEMQVHYSEKGHAMGISWNGGSLTPFSFKNPNYRLYTVEPVTYQVVDHSTWIFNLTAANEHGSDRAPIWFEEYSFSDFTKDLSPGGVDALLNRMAENPDILRLLLIGTILKIGHNMGRNNQEQTIALSKMKIIFYWQYKITSADPQLLKGCNDNCLLSTICNLAVSVYNEKRQCEELKIKLKKSLNQ